jgi:hypothetical protein
MVYRVLLVSPGHAAIVEQMVGMERLAHVGFRVSQESRGGKENEESEEKMACMVWME